MKKQEYDFITFTSFPSSTKLTNDEETLTWGSWLYEGLPVEPGKTLKIQVKAKQSLVTLANSGVSLSFWDGTKRIHVHGIVFPLGNFDWQSFETEQVVPPGAVNARSLFYGGGGKPQGETWFDDLRVYQDDVLIYSNDFSNYNPYIGAGVGGVGGAAVGGVADHLIHPEKPLTQLDQDLIVASLVGAGAGAGLGALIGWLVPPQVGGAGQQVSHNPPRSEVQGSEIIVKL